MDALELKAEPRELTRGRVKELRQQGIIPAVVYGKNRETQQVQINSRDLGKILSEAGTHQLISLKIGSKKPVMTLARDIQRDVIRRDYLHVDFFMVRMDEKVTARVPLVIEGTAPGVQDQGGVLTQNMDEIEIECLPSDLISSIPVDISNLMEFNEFISVSELQVPDTITVMSDPDSMVVKIEPPRKVEDLEALDEELPVGGAEPEVITEAKEEEE